MEDLPLRIIAALVPEFAVKDLPLGRTLMTMMLEYQRRVQFKWIVCSIFINENIFVVKLELNSRTLVFGKLTLVFESGINLSVLQY